MNLRPNKKKIIGSLIIGIILSYFILGFYLQTKCIEDTGCFSFLSPMNYILGLFATFFLPIIISAGIVYVIWSLFQRK
tara:strand:+ start:422 stop:655 length:234 start_codon:yes stop_codon:yes gene_type:complete